MKSNSLLTMKVTGKTAVILLVLLAIPGFLWFRYLFDEFIVKPNQVSPEMQKMRDSIMMKAAKKTEPVRAGKGTAKAPVQVKHAEMKAADTNEARKKPEIPPQKAGDKKEARETSH